MISFINIVRIQYTIATVNPTNPIDHKHVTFVPRFRSQNLLSLLGDKFSELFFLLNEASCFLYYI